MALTRIRLSLAAMCITVLAASSASAQVFGTFTWQMQNFCNRVILTLTSLNGNFTLDGFDDQCGATNKASAVGVAIFNAAGNVTFNFSIVTAPSAKPVHVSAIVSPVNGNGSWIDSVGNSGTFVLSGAVPGLPARPLPTSGVAPATITAIELAPDSVGASEIAPDAVGASEIAPNAVGASELAPAAVSATKIAAGAVTAAALGTITRRSATSAAIAPGAPGNVGVQCLAGEQVLSGGNDASTAINLPIIASRDDGAGWRVFVRNDSAGNQTVTVHAYCLAP